MKLHKTLPDDAYLEIMMSESLKQDFGFKSTFSAERERLWLELPHSLRRDIFYNVGNYSFLLVQFFVVDNRVRISSKNIDRRTSLDERFFLKLAETTEIVDIDINGYMMDIHLSNGVVI